VAVQTNKKICICFGADVKGGISTKDYSVILNCMEFLEGYIEGTGQFTRFRLTRDYVYYEYKITPKK